MKLTNTFSVQTGGVAVLDQRLAAAFRNWYFVQNGSFVWKNLTQTKMVEKWEFNKMVVSQQICYAKVKMVATI